MKTMTEPDFDFIMALSLTTRWKFAVESYRIRRRKAYHFPIDLRTPEEKFHDSVDALNEWCN